MNINQPPQQQSQSQHDSDPRTASPSVQAQSHRPPSSSSLSSATSTTSNSARSQSLQFCPAFLPQDRTTLEQDTPTRPHASCRGPSSRSWGASASRISRRSATHTSNYGAMGTVILSRSRQRSGPSRIPSSLMRRKSLACLGHDSASWLRSAFPHATRDSFCRSPSSSSS